MEREMEYVYAVYQEESFTKAAERLFISQPALSAMVKKAENSIGAEIFNRSTTPISLTKEGEEYIFYIEKLMQVYKEMDDYFELNAKNVANTIRVGGTAFFCSYMFPPVIEKFKKEYPTTNFTFLEATNTELAERLAKGQLDLFIEVDEINKSGIKRFSWGTEEILLAVPKDCEVNNIIGEFALTEDDLKEKLHKGNVVKRVSIDYFKNQRFVLMKEGNDSYSRAIEICRNEGFEPNVFMKVDTLMTASLLASEGYGVTFVRDELPNSIYLNNKLVFYRIEDSLSSRDIYVYHQENKNVKLIVKRFISFMKEHPLDQSVQI